MRKYVTEFIGTFFLVLTIGCTVLTTSTGVIPPLAIGAVLMVMIFAGGHISGGHYNPAVTLGVFLRGRCPAADVAPYMLSQIAGGLLASGAVRYLVPGNQAVPLAPVLGHAFLAEFLFTFALVYVVLNVATSKDNAGNSFYGLAIGFTVMSGAFAVGGTSGAAFNPAVAIGAAALGLVSAGTLWVLIVPQLMAGAAAAFVFSALNPEDR